MRLLRTTGLAVIVAASLARSARADDAPRDAGTAIEPIAPIAPYIPPPPHGMARKRRLSDDDLARKNEGGYFTGLPLVAYDPNFGPGFGARVYYYDNGQRDDPLFAYTPYMQRVFAQGFATTGGAQYHWLDWDAPNFMHSLFRVRASVEYEQQIHNYFGVGSRGLAPLAFPGSNKTFAKASDYDQQLRTVQPDGTTFGRYDQFFFRRPSLQLALERIMLGGVVRPLIGLGFSYAALRDYTGAQIDAFDANGRSVQAPQATTRLAADCAASRIVGCAGGFDNVVRLALSIDTRDFEPDPNQGIYAEVSAELGTRALGSEYDYARLLFSVRGFYSPIPKLADVVLAGRFLYELQSAGTPFFSMNTLPFIDDNHAGLGGLRTLRGFREDRFVGPMIVLTNYEVRWTFLKFKAFRQDFGVIAVPFLDIGRVFDNVRTTTLAGWKRSQGGGIRVAWNEATIVMVDYGFSDEDTGLYLNFNHIF